MSDLYREILVKKQQTGADKAKKAALIAGIVLFAAAGIVVHPVLLIGALGLGIAAYFLLPGLNLEYEYLYVNGDFDIDKIMSQQKRKRCASYNVADLEIAAPTGSHDLDSFTSGGKAKIKDYTSGDPQAKSWSLVYKSNEGYDLVRMELEEAVISDLRRIAPRKVSRC